MASDSPKRFTPTMKTKLCQEIATRLNFNKSMMTNEVLFEQFYAVQNEIVPEAYRCGPAAWADNREWVMACVKKAKPEKPLAGKGDAALTRRVSELETAIQQSGVNYNGAMHELQHTQQVVAQQAVAVRELADRVSKITAANTSLDKKLELIKALDATNQRQKKMLDDQGVELKRFETLCSNQQKVIDEQQATTQALKQTMDHLMKELGLEADSAQLGASSTSGQSPATDAPAPEIANAKKPDTTDTKTLVDVAIVGLHANAVRSVRESHGKLFNLHFIDKSMAAGRVASACAGMPTVVIFGGCSGGVQDAVKKTAEPYIHLGHGAGASTVKRSLDTLLTDLREKAATKPNGKKKVS